MSICKKSSTVKRRQTDRFRGEYSFYCHLKKTKKNSLITKGCDHLKPCITSRNTKLEDSLPYNQSIGVILEHAH